MNLPTAAEKAGKFRLPPVLTIYNPTTHLPFPNDTIPASMIQPAIKPA